MSISSSIYVGTTGVMAQQENMSVISDNIANMNTVGFKSARMLFSTMISEQLTGATSGNQVGMGVGVSSIWQNLSVGPLETTSTATHMAISGNGYFMVSPETSDAIYYTKAGNFTFDKDGYLRDPQNNIVQGYALTPQAMVEGDIVTPAATEAAIGDVLLTTENGTAVSAPEATTAIQMMVNLDSDSDNHSSSTTSPFTALFDSWDATDAEPLAAGSYAYESSLKVYDANGNTHVLTAYFDPATPDVTDDTNGSKVWEYLITVPPGEDGSALNTKVGILMAGTMTFSPAGEISNISAFQGTSDDPSAWTPVALSEDGLPSFTMTLNDGTTMTSALDFGIRSTSGWTAESAGTTLATLGTATTGLPKFATAQTAALGTTNYNSGSSSIYQSQNGYARGYLQSVSVNADGVILGNFSNGQEQGLYKIPLADFINPQGLFREGGNLFSATKDSGAATMGWAGEGRLGSIAGSTVENSNVDLATEFVNMITTQKGFDANSKVITTADQVVQTALGMKK